VKKSVRKQQKYRHFHFQ